MNAHLLVPLVLAVGASYLLMSLQPKLPPQLTAWLLVVVGSATAMSGAWLLVLVSLAFIGHQHRVDRWLGWCDHIVSGHDGVAFPIGIGAVVGVVAMTTMALRTVRRYRRGWRPVSGEATELIDDERIVAHAVPGRHRSAGTVVVSTGMIAALDPDELRAVMAHERAHLVHRHHRFLVAIDIAASIVPFVRPLRARIRLATERWADEDAARDVASRRVVATAVARAALATAPFAYSMSMSGSSTMVRVNALLEPSAAGRRSWTMAMLIASGLSAAALVATTVQVHHALDLFGHLCS